MDTTAGVLDSHAVENAGKKGSAREALGCNVMTVLDDMSNLGAFFYRASRLTWFGAASDWRRPSHFG